MKSGWIIHTLTRATKEELRNIAGDENEIKERFYMDLNLVLRDFAESLEPESTV